MNFFIQRIFVILLPVLLGSCIARIDVKKINNADINGRSRAKGVRYSLPQPFVIGTPGLNGKVSYRVEYLPDPDNEYAVNAWSFMAKHTMKLARSPNGMLTSVDYSKNDTEVATAMVDTAGNLAKAQIEAMAKKASSADRSGPNNHDGDEVPHVSTTAAGPVIYRVVEDPYFGVRLEPVSIKAMLNGGRLTPAQQRMFETTGSATEDGKPGPTKPALVEPKGASAETLMKNTLLSQDQKIGITFNTEVTLEAKDCVLKAPDGTPIPFDSGLYDVKMAEDHLRGVVTLKKSDKYSKGSYSLTLKVSTIKKPIQVGNVDLTIPMDN